MAKSQIFFKVLTTKTIPHFVILSTKNLHLTVKLDSSNPCAVTQIRCLKTFLLPSYGPNPFPVTAQGLEPSEGKQSQKGSHVPAAALGFERVKVALTPLGTSVSLTYTFIMTDSINIF
jgi:hypothetical protein